MYRKITPQICAEALWAVQTDLLLQCGVSTILLDMDNTLAYWKSAEVPQENLRWLECARREGFKFYIVSNGKKERVDALARKLKIGCVKNAGKPSKKRMQAIIKQLGVRPEETALVGDQLFTDILAANRCGMVAVLVQPLDRKREWWATKAFNRSRERLVWKKVFKDGQNP